jgi:hypothetical protein
MDVNSETIPPVASVKTYNNDNGVAIFLATIEEDLPDFGCRIW